MPGAFFALQPFAQFFGETAVILALGQEEFHAQHGAFLVGGGRPLAGQLFSDAQQIGVHAGADILDQPGQFDAGIARSCRRSGFFRVFRRHEQAAGQALKQAWLAGARLFSWRLGCWRFAHLTGCGP